MTSLWFQDYNSEGHLTRRLNEAGCPNVIKVLEWAYLEPKPSPFQDMSLTSLPEEPKFRIAYEVADHGDLHRVVKWYHEHKYVAFFYCLSPSHAIPCHPMPSHAIPCHPISSRALPSPLYFFSLFSRKQEAHHHQSHLPRSLHLAHLLQHRQRPLLLRARIERLARASRRVGGDSARGFEAGEYTPDGSGGRAVGLVPNCQIGGFRYVYNSMCSFM